MKGNFNKKRDFLGISGAYVERYWLIYTIIMATVLFIEISKTILFVAGITEKNDPLYLTLYLFLIVITAIAMIYMLIQKGKKHEEITGIVIHLYTTLVICCATLFSILDMNLATTEEYVIPISYITALVSVAGIVVIQPLIFGLLAIVSYSCILIFGNAAAGFFTSSSFLNITILFVLAGIMAWKNYRVGFAEFRIREKLRKLSYRDYLTGLGNETSYYEAVDNLEVEILSGEAKFGVMTLDVNNVKATNDALGHRFGCHLIVKTGKTLPTIFKNSKFYHIGGDEFVGIIKGKDLDNLQDLLKILEEKLEYKKITYEGKEIILSVAYGYDIYDGRPYKDVYQVADERMYYNKSLIKEKHHLEVR